LDGDGLFRVGQKELEAAFYVAALGGIEAGGEAIEEHIGGNGADIRAALRAVARRLRGFIAAQGGGGAEIIVPPCAGFGLIAELIIGRGERGAGGGVFWLGENEFAEDFGGPAIIARLQRGFANSEQAVRASGKGDIFGGGFRRRQRVEIGGVAIPPAEIALIGRLHIMIERAIIIARGEGRGLDGGLGRLIGEFVKRCTLVGEVERAVVDIAIDVALAGQQRVDFLGAPCGP
jgi:hypothetical protein